MDPALLPLLRCPIGGGPLTLDVITPLLPLLIERSRRMLLLSGILVEQEDVITVELRKLQVTNFQVARSGEWISILIRKS